MLELPPSPGVMWEWSSTVNVHFPSPPRTCPHVSKMFFPLPKCACVCVSKMQKFSSPLQSQKCKKAGKGKRALSFPQREGREREEKRPPRMSEHQDPSERRATTHHLTIIHSCLVLSPLLSVVPRLSSPVPVCLFHLPVSTQVCLAGLLSGPHLGVVGRQKGQSHRGQKGSQKAGQGATAAGLLCVFMGRHRKNEKCKKSCLFGWVRVHVCMVVVCSVSFSPW